MANSGFRHTASIKCIKFLEATDSGILFHFTVTRPLYNFHLEETAQLFIRENSDH